MSDITRRRGALGLTLLAAAVAAFIALPAASAGASAGAVQVRGLMEPAASGRCAGGATVTGSLTGCWYIDTGDVVHGSWTSSGLRATGTEHFVGCLDGDQCGTLFTTFVFTAKFAADGSEIHGRCHHPIVGGEGDFAGATGEIEMHDLPNGCATYTGNIRLGT